MTKVKRTALIALVAVVGAIALVPSLAGAADSTYDPSTRLSQRDWMRANGTNPGEWVLREKFKSDGTKRSLTHGDRANPADALASALPGVDCQSSCHQVPRGTKTDKQIWDNIDAYETAKLADPAFEGYKGFTNAFGDTATYRGKIFYPADLLLDPNNTTKHAENFKTGGCGFCHSPKAAFDRGALDDEGKADLKGCVNCHNFGLGDPVNNLHLTHGTLITAEIPVADKADTGATSCNFCHGASMPGQALKDSPKNASCYNCHLSGHWPQVPYWSAEPKALADALGSLPPVPAP